MSENDTKNAAYTVQGYYLPTPHEQTIGLYVQAFERARNEAIASHERAIYALQSLKFDQFLRTKECPWRRSEQEKP